jgi:uncharacterized protein
MPVSFAAGVAHSILGELLTVMLPELDDIELRVLGVLIEKSLSQPGIYPLTINAIIQGANQKQNRDPVMELTEADVARALGRLQQKSLAEQAPPAPGARANRFKHSVVEKFQWDRRDQAIMAELMIRGRQTPGELRTHASRLTPFGDLESVQATLRELAGKETPFVMELPREPGRSANRWKHMLGGDGVAVGAGEQGRSTSTEAESGVEASSQVVAESATSDLAQLVNRLVRLEARVECLEREVARLQGSGRSGAHLSDEQV